MSFSEQMDGLFKLHLVAQGLEHATRKRGECNEWVQSVSSEFVYSYFVFNSLYATHWGESVKTGQMTDWETHQKNVGGGRKYEFDRIQAMTKFIGNDKLNASLSKNFKRHLRVNEGTACQALMSIQSDSRISDKMNRQFQKPVSITVDIKKAFGNIVQNQDIVNSVDTMLCFIFHVRNNVFHGSKWVLPNVDVDQGERLKIYTAVLLAVNDLLFDAVEETTKGKKEEWSRDKVLREQEQQDRTRME